MLRFGLFRLFAIALLAGCAPDSPNREAVGSLAAAINSGQIAIPGCPCTDLAATRASDGHVELFARSHDGNLWRAWEDGPNGTFSASNVQRLTASGIHYGSGGRGRYLPGDTIVGAPVAIRSAVDGDVHVFYQSAVTGILQEIRGTKPALWDALRSGLSGLANPAVVNFVDSNANQVLLFGTATDGQLSSMTYAPDDGDFYSYSWRYSPSIAALPGGATISGKISAVQVDQQLWLFARDTSGATWSTSGSPAGGFGPWTNLGGYLQFPAEATVDSNGEINLAGVGGDGQIWLALQREFQDTFDAWTPLVSGAVSGSSGASNSAPHFGTNIDGSLAVFFNNSSGSSWAVSQCGAGTWTRRQTELTRAGGSWWSAADVAVVSEDDGRLVGFSLAADGSVGYMRADKPTVIPNKGSADMSGAGMSGSVTGRYQCGVSTYRGIPFATPPVGPLRWKPPFPPASWSSLDAGRFKPMCPQGANAALGNEDCLYANVFAPTGASAKSLPVMVFFHGGGGKAGGTADYDATALVKRAAELGSPVIVVTLAYRLGVLSQLVYPGVSDGNLQLADQVAGLRWVQQNIAPFGGDPARVTVFGQSAGASYLSVLLTMPGNAGLFWAAALESGAQRHPYPTAAQAATLGAAIAQELQKTGCGSPSTCFAHAPLADIVNAAKNVANNRDPYNTVLQPHIDGTYIVADRATAWTQNLTVPLLLGTTREEAAAGTSPQDPPQASYAKSDYEAFLFGPDGFGTGTVNYQNPAAPYDCTVAPKVLQLYPGSDPDSGWQLISLVSDVNTLCPTRAVGRLAANAGHAVYRYLFTHVAEDPDALTQFATPLSSWRAFHGAELPFVFASLGDRYRATPAEWALSDAIIGYWTRFAATQNPNGAGAPVWPVYPAAGASAPILTLDDNITVSNGYDEAQCDYFDTLYPEAATPPGSCP